jgi:hypothetical protein
MYLNEPTIYPNLVVCLSGGIPDRPIRVVFHHKTSSDERQQYQIATDVINIALLKGLTAEQFCLKVGGESCVQVRWKVDNGEYSVKRSVSQSVHMFSKHFAAASELLIWFSEASPSTTPDSSPHKMKPGKQVIHLYYYYSLCCCAVCVCVCVCMHALYLLTVSLFLRVLYRCFKTYQEGV